MATINVQDVKKELGEYIENNTDVVSAGVYSDEIALNKHCVTITSINGQFPSFHQIMGHVVQGFKAQWQKLGEAEFKHKILKNFRQKVNFEIVPDEVLNTWLAELFTEGKSKEEHPISKKIMEDLMKKVIDDLDDLSQTGVYDPVNAAGQFGKSMNGIAQAIIEALADLDHPAFKIPLDVITDANRLDQMIKFEFGIPKKTRKKVKKLFMSTTNKMKYAAAYEKEYGTKVTYKDSDTILTPLTKLEIVGLDNIPDTLYFAPAEGVMARLIDVFDKPQVTDIQILDYVLKIFMDWFLGYDFLINELVYVAVFDDSDRGLGNAELNELYYDSENLVVTP